MTQRTRAVSCCLAVWALAAALTGCDGVVEPATVAGVQVNLSDVTFELGDSLDVVAVAVDASGNPIVDRPVIWASNNPRIVTITSDGVFRAVGAGSTTVSAESGGEHTEVAVAVTAHFERISGGFLHTCGTTQSGHVACWGTNNYGELGDSTVFTASIPVLVASDSNLSAVSAGGSHTCALNASGLPMCWGANWSAQLGRGTVDGVPHSAPSAVASSFTFARLETGDRHACGLTEVGAAYCWGGGFSGQLGNGDQTFICQAVQEACNTLPEAVLGGLAFSTITAGDEHTCALLQDGTAYCWGDDRFGQLGDSAWTPRSDPAQVVGGHAFTTIAAGARHSCALDALGAAYCWGNNVVGQLGADADSSSSVPLAVNGGVVFLKLDVGGFHTCGIDTGGSAYCWGGNNYGQLGIGTTDDAAEPLPVATDLRFTQITTGWTHTCAIATDGDAYCWGRNTAGQLGIGTVGGIRTTPTRLVGQG